MTYVNDQLISGEQVVYEAKIHWVVLVFPIILIWLPPLALIWLLVSWLQMRTTEMALTNKRVIIKVGIISRKTLEMNLNKIENISVDQGILGRMLNYGKITIIGTGGTREPFNYISSPLEFRKHIQTNQPT